LGAGKKPPIPSKSRTKRLFDGIKPERERVHRFKVPKRKEKTMLNIKIDEMAALDLLMGRLNEWTKDQKTKELYQKMYESYIDCGCFDGCEFDPMVIVDNDWVNYCTIIDESDENFEKIKKLYKENGLGDVSCEDVGYSFIEASDDDDEPTAFLMRY